MIYCPDSARDYVLSKDGVSEETPFGPDVLVYKVAGKMFATLAFEDEIGRMNLKCDPERSVDLRESYSAILPGYHMNKKHWNTLLFTGELEAALVIELIDHSYSLVISGLTQKQRSNL